MQLKDHVMGGQSLQTGSVDYRTIYKSNKTVNCLTHCHTHTNIT